MSILTIFWLMIKFMFGLALAFAGVIFLAGVVIYGITGLINSIKKTI